MVGVPLRAAVAPRAAGRPPAPPSTTCARQGTHLASRADQAALRAQRRLSGPHNRSQGHLPSVVRQQVPPLLRSSATKHTRARTRAANPTVPIIAPTHRNLQSMVPHWSLYYDEN